MTVRRVLGMTRRSRMRGKTRRKNVCPVPGHGSCCGAVWEMGGGKVMGRSREREEWQAEALAEMEGYVLPSVETADG